MKYLVMECHLSYAVVLDEAGRFIKVANIHYEPGQTLTEVIEMQLPQSVHRKKKINRWLYSFAAMAACLMIMLTYMFHREQTTYASVYMTINPEVCINVNNNDVVVSLYGVNDDGNDLVEDYDYSKKDLKLVMEELVDKAILMGYLHEGGHISLVLDADNHEWVLSHSDILSTQLNEHLAEKMPVTIDVADKNTEKNQVTIPIAPSENEYDESDYGVSDYDATEPAPVLPSDSDASNSDYSDSAYGESDDDHDGTSNYSYEDGQSEYEPNDSDTDYESPSNEDGTSGDYGHEDEEQSDYDSEEDTNEYNDTDYDSDEDYDADDEDLNDRDSDDEQSDYDSEDDD